MPKYLRKVLLRFLPYTRKMACYSIPGTSLMLP